LIKKITKTKITQICSECGKTNVVDVDSLIVGIENDKNIVLLPECSCGAQEFLNRTFDSWGEHAIIVNSLHYYLHKKGKVDPKVKENLDKEKEKDKPKNKVDMDKWIDKDYLENNGGFVKGGNRQTSLKTKGENNVIRQTS